MKRKFLEDLGLEKEVIDKILDENSSDIGKAKGEFDSTASERDQLKADIKIRDKQLEDLKKVDAEALKAQIEKLQGENKTAKQKYETDLKQVRRDSIDESLLVAAKAKNAKAVKALLDAADDSLDEEGYKAFREKQLKQLQEGEDSKFLFNIETPNPNPFKGAKPGEGKDKTPGTVTKDQFNKMGYKERNELYNTDKATYDALVGTK